MNAKIYLPLLILAFTAVAVPVGCQPSSGLSARKARIAIVISTLNNPWFVVLGETAKARVQELGFEATLFDSQNDPATEAAHFENIIAGGYGAILLNATDSDGSIASVRKAKSHDIPVFCIDREINATDVATSQILSDSYSGCVALGEYFAEQLGEKGNYVEILGQVGDNNTWNRSKGFHSVTDRFPKLKMVAQQSADFDRGKAHDVMESLLQAHRDLDAVFCGNDAMAMGAYQALVSSGKSEQVKVFGFDGADDVVRLIAEGKIAATGMQFPKTMARTAAEYAGEWIKGGDFPQKVPVAVELVTPENVSQYGDYGKSRDGKAANDGSSPMIRRLVLSIAAMVGVALVAWVLPPFHIVPLDKARESREQATFNPSEFAEKFWDEQLVPTLPQASSAKTVLDAIDDDFQAAGEKYGRTVGISNSYYVFIQGVGRVVNVTSRVVGLAIRDGSGGPDVVLPVGLVFGNTVRDATGLLDMNKFPNSQHFNDISTELNLLVESRVLPQLRDRAEVGREIRFVGCAEVFRDPKRRKPLKVVPVRVDFTKPGQPE